MQENRPNESKLPPFSPQVNAEVVNDALEDSTYDPDDLEGLAKEATTGIGDYQRSQEFVDLVAEDEVTSRAQEAIKNLTEIASDAGRTLNEMLCDPAFTDKVLSGETAGMDPRDRVRLLGIIALTAKPVGQFYTEQTVISRKEETPAQKSWRKAVNSLRSFAYDEPTAARFEEASDDEVATQKLEERVRAAAQARYWLANLTETTHTTQPPGDTQKGLQERVEASTAIDLADFMQIPIGELDFAVLPAGNGETRSHRSSEDRAHADTVLRELDPARIALIIELLNTFPDKNGRVYLSRKRDKDGKLHRSVELVTVFDIDDAHQVAMAERPAGHIKNNEAAVFIVSELVTAGTWQEVLAQGRKGITGYGAEKVVHTGEWEVRIKSRLQEILA